MERNKPLLLSGSEIFCIIESPGNTHVPLLQSIVIRNAVQLSECATTTQL